MDDYKKYDDLNQDLKKILEDIGAISREDLNDPETLKRLSMLRANARAILKILKTQLVPEFVLKARQRYPKAYMPWSPEEDILVKQYFEAGQAIMQISKTMERSFGSIRSRLIKFGLIKDNAVSDGNDEDVQECELCEKETDQGEEDADGNFLCWKCEEGREENYVKGLVFVCTDCGKEYNVSDESSGNEESTDDPIEDQNEEYTDDDEEQDIPADGLCPACGGMLVSIDVDFE